MFREHISHGGQGSKCPMELISIRAPVECPSTNQASLWTAFPYLPHFVKSGSAFYGKFQEWDASNYFKKGFVGIRRSSGNDLNLL